MMTTQELQQKITIAQAVVARHEKSLDTLDPKHLLYTVERRHILGMIDTANRNMHRWQRQLRDLEAAQS